MFESPSSRKAAQVMMGRFCYQVQAQRLLPRTATSQQTFSQSGRLGLCHGISGIYAHGFQQSAPDGSR